MGINNVRVLRGKFIDTDEYVAVLVFELPDGKRGASVIDAASVFGVPLSLETATDQQIIDRIREYASSRDFLIDLLNGHMWDLENQAVSAWLNQIQVIYTGDMNLCAIENTESTHVS